MLRKRVHGTWYLVPGTWYLVLVRTYLHECSFETGNFLVVALPDEPHTFRNVTHRFSRQRHWRGLVRLTRVADACGLGAIKNDACTHAHMRTDREIHVEQ